MKTKINVSTSDVLDIRNVPAIRTLRNCHKCGSLCYGDCTVTVAEHVAAYESDEATRIAYSAAERAADEAAYVNAQS